MGAGGGPKVPMESRAPKIHASPPGRRIQHDGHVVHKRLMVSARAASSQGGHFPGPKTKGQGHWGHQFKGERRGQRTGLFINLKRDWVTSQTSR